MINKKTGHYLAAKGTCSANFAEVNEVAFPVTRHTKTMAVLLFRKRATPT